MGAVPGHVDAPLETSPLLGSKDTVSQRNHPPRTRKLALACLVVLLASASLTVFIRSRSEDVHYKNSTLTTTIKVAHVGNSIQYYQDLPRLLEHMLRTRFDHVVQNSCIHGGSSITSLWEDGNLMNVTFHTPNARRADGTYDIGADTVEDLLAEQDWDFLVMNDFTQGAARLTTRTASKVTLRDQYVPLLRKMGTTLVFLQTAAYEIQGVRETEDLGDFDEFTRLTRAGYEEYLAMMLTHNCSARIAPSGMAFSYIRHRQPDLFPRMYAQDYFHPSPHGTWLEGCVVYCTILNEMPPKYDITWWNTARYIQPGLPFPTNQEAEEIRMIAGHICGLTKADDGAKGNVTVDKLDRML